MKVNNYKLYYINKEKGIKDILNLIKKSSYDQIVLIIRSEETIISNIATIKILNNKLQKEIIFINSDSDFLECFEETDFTVYSDLKEFKTSLTSENKSQTDKIKDKLYSFYKKKQNKIQKLSQNKNNENEKNEKTTNINKSDIIDDKNNQENKKGILQKYQSKRKNNKKLHYIASFVALLGVFFLGWTYFVSPAVVSVTPLIDTTEQEINFRGSLRTETIDWERLILPLHKFEIMVTDSLELKTTGSETKGMERAEGKVRFINEKEEEIYIPENTEIKTEDSIKFVTQEEAVIPGLEKEYSDGEQVGVEAGQKTVPIQAVEKGTTGNVDLGEITQFVEERDGIYVVNPEQTQGGRDKTVSVVTEADHEQLENQIMDKVRDGLLSQLYAELDGNYYIIRDEIDYKPEEINFEQKPGKKAEYVEGTIKVRADGYMVHNNQLNQKVSLLFNQNINNEIDLVGDKINITGIDLEEVSQDLYNIKVRTQAPVISSIDSDELAQQLAGKDIEQAYQILEDKREIQNYEIDFNKEDLPGISYLIRLIVREPEV